MSAQAQKEQEAEIEDETFGPLPIAKLEVIFYCKFFSDSQ